MRAEETAASPGRGRRGKGISKRAWRPEHKQRLGSSNSPVCTDPNDLRSERNSFPMLGLLR
eukprot:8447330-Pyramimonas_sp.AAC.1